MPQFDAVMRVVHIETWSVEAENQDEARKKFENCSEDVDTDETGGETIDWQITRISPART